MTRVAGLAEATRRTVNTVAFAFLVPAVVVFFGLMFLTTADVLFRLGLKRPITGVVDMTKCMMILMCWLGAAWAMVKEKHMSVDFVVGRLRPGLVIIIEVVNSIIGLGFSAIVVWGGTIFAIKSWQEQAILETLTAIPETPFRFAIAVGASLLCVVLAVRLVEQLNKAVKGMGGPKETSHTKEAKP